MNSLFGNESSLFLLNSLDVITIKDLKEKEIKYDIYKIKQILHLSSDFKLKIELLFW